MARFVIADVTTPKVVLQELDRIVRNVALPVVPLLEKGSRRKEPTTLYDLRTINPTAVLDTCWYKDKTDLLRSFKQKVIEPVEAKVEELAERRVRLLVKKAKKRPKK